MGRFAGRWASLGWVADVFMTDGDPSWAHTVTLTLSTPVASS